MLFRSHKKSLSSHASFYAQSTKQMDKVKCCAIGHLHDYVNIPLLPEFFRAFFPVQIRVFSFQPSWDFQSQMVPGRSRELM